MYGPTEDERISYGRVAIWGMAASAVLTAAFLALSPVSPVRLAATIVEEGPVGLLARGGTAGAARGAPGGVVHVGIGAGLPEAVLRTVAVQELGHHAEVLGRQLGDEVRRDVARELRRELRRGIRGGGAIELRGELIRELSRELPALTTELTRDLSGLSVEVRPRLSPG